MLSTIRRAWERITAQHRPTRQADSLPMFAVFENLTVMSESQHRTVFAAGPDLASNLSVSIRGQQRRS
ncbi:hypothetical protein ACQR16_28640 [Bradyrhizobium oligotrophicum]|uniref:hypothetical protein n=1 Tax=Bradyrhizobium oligotrophicum TaxID=44255 RepID=UPI003EBA4B8E